MPKMGSLRGVKKSNSRLTKTVRKAMKTTPVVYGDKVTKLAVAKSKLNSGRTSAKATKTDAIKSNKLSPEAGGNMKKEKLTKIQKMDNKVADGIRKGSRSDQSKIAKYGK